MNCFLLSDESKLVIKKACIYGMQTELNREQISRGRGDGVGGNGLFEIAGCFSTVEDIYIFILTGKE